MIPDDLRRGLVTALSKVPSVGADGDHIGRTGLLAGIPIAGFISRNRHNASGDILLIVSQLEETFGPEREWYLLKLIDNVLLTTTGTDLGRQIIRLRAELADFDNGSRSGAVHPAELAQVHLFDLRKSIFACIGGLPQKPKASGFVIGTPTARLLGYFRDSLKHRGAEYNTWSRDDVAMNGPPMVVDPKHTPIAAVVAKVAQVRAFLATKHVLWPIFIDSASDAADLWRQLAAEFQGPLNHHLVIAFGMPVPNHAPVSMTRLPSPMFSRTHILEWVGEIGKTLTWKDEKVAWWTSIILLGYFGDHDDLPVEMVYERLEQHSRLVAQYPKAAQLEATLKELEAWG